MDATTAGYEDRRLLDFYERVLERVAALPGVQAAAFSRWGLLEGGSTRDGIRVAGRRAGQGGRRRPRPLRVARLLRDDGDSAAGRTRRVGAGSGDGAAVAVVNQALARQIAREPAGRRRPQRAASSGPDKPVEIVGLAADARFASLRDPAPPTIYLPYRQHRQHRMSFAVRVAGDPTALTEAVRRAVAGVDADVPLFGVRTQVDQIDVAVRQERVFALARLGLRRCSRSCWPASASTARSATAWPGAGPRSACAWRSARRRGDVVSLVLRESLAPVPVGAAIGHRAGAGDHPLRAEPAVRDRAARSGDAVRRDDRAARGGAARRLAAVAARLRRRSGGGAASGVSGVSALRSCATGRARRCRRPGPGAASPSGRRPGSRARRSSASA